MQFLCLYMVIMNGRVKGEGGRCLHTFLFTDVFSCCVTKECNKPVIQVCSEVKKRIILMTEFDFSSHSEILCAGKRHLEVCKAWTRCEYCINSAICRSHSCIHTHADKRKPKCFVPTAEEGEASRLHRCRSLCHVNQEESHVHRPGHRG